MAQIGPAELPGILLHPLGRIVLRQSVALTHSLRVAIRPGRFGWVGALHHVDYVARHVLEDELRRLSLTRAGGGREARRDDGQDRDGDGRTVFAADGGPQFGGKPLREQQAADAEQCGAPAAREIGECTGAQVLGKVVLTKEREERCAEEGVVNLGPRCPG